MKPLSATAQGGGGVWHKARGRSTDRTPFLPPCINWGTSGRGATAGCRLCTLPTPLCPGLTPTVMVTLTWVLSGGTPWSYTSTVTTSCPSLSSSASRSSGSLLCICPVVSLMVKLLLKSPGRIL